MGHVLKIRRAAVKCLIIDAKCNKTFRVEIMGICTDNILTGIGHQWLTEIIRRKR